jgi:AraC-like DNA-binding protein
MGLHLYSIAFKKLQLEKSDIHSANFLTDVDIRRLWKNNVKIEIQPILILLVKSGWIEFEGDYTLKTEKQSIAYHFKIKPGKFVAMSNDCECILIHYERSFLKNMSLQLSLIDAFKFVYTNNKVTFKPPLDGFEDLWLLSKFTYKQIQFQKNGELNYHLIKHLNYSFLYSFIKILGNISSNDLNPNGQKEKIVLQFFINLRDSKKLIRRVSDYAKMQNITSRHLSVTVKEISGSTAKEIIHRATINRAKEQLTSTHMQISEIAYNLGFPDPYTFSHFFKKHGEMSPTEFRLRSKY